VIICCNTYPTFVWLACVACSTAIIQDWLHCAAWAGALSDARLSEEQVAENLQVPVSFAPYAVADQAGSQHQHCSAPLHVSLFRRQSFTAPC
jgi:hypothetical protein